MNLIKTLIISGFGTNSHRETAYAASLAGSDKVEIMHFADLVSLKGRLKDYQFLIFPGGFLDGDDLGAAQTAAIRWRYLKNESNIALLDMLNEFIYSGGLILGICNGFQLLVKLGLLPGLGEKKFVRQVSLAPNKSAKFEDRWVNLRVNPKSKCIFTQNLSSLKMPVRHGEGRLVAENQQILENLEAENLIALTYTKPDSIQPTMEYPYNPNGSVGGIAGLTDPSGHILGLMPHPEAFHHFGNHPKWTRGELDPPGTLVFANAINYLRNN